MTAGPRPTQVDPIIRALAGWQPARVLMTANRLDVFNALGEDALDAATLARKCGCHPRSLKMLLDACVALGFLVARGGCYANTEQGRNSLIRGKPTYIGDGINHADGLWFRWAHLSESVRTNKAAAALPGPVGGEQGYRDFILAMHNRAMRNAEALAEGLDLSGRRRLFDVGGGPGTYSVFLVRKNPGLKAIVFDLPPAVEIARGLIAEAGLADRITTRAGDFYRDDFGTGNDVVLISAIVHMMRPQRAKLLVRKSHASLKKAGLIVIHESLIDDSKRSPVGPALFSLNMLVNTGEGRSYSGREISGWLREGGFTDVRVEHLPPLAGTSLVIGVKP